MYSAEGVKDVLLKGAGPGEEGSVTPGVCGIRRPGGELAGRGRF